MFTIYTYCKYLRTKNNKLCTFANNIIIILQTILYTVKTEKYIIIVRVNRFIAKVHIAAYAKTE